MPGDARALVERFIGKGEQLAERWSKFPGSKIRGWEKYRKVNFLEGISKNDTYKRAVLGHLFENTYDWMYNQLDETTRMQMVGSYEKYIFPILRAVYANLVAEQLVTVQPLDAPHGLVFSAPGCEEVGIAA